MNKVYLIVMDDWVRDEGSDTTILGCFLNFEESDKFAAECAGYLKAKPASISTKDYVELYVSSKKGGYVGTNIELREIKIGVNPHYKDYFSVSELEAKP